MTLCSWQDVKIQLLTNSSSFNFFFFFFFLLSKSVIPYFKVIKRVPSPWIVEMLFWNINIRIACMNLCLQSPDDLFETISQALMNAFDRDAVSGWGAVVYIMWVGLLVFKGQCWLFQIVLSYLTVCKEFAPIPETPGAPPSSADTVGWFSEAGLLEWMCFVIFRARSRKRLQHTSRPISEYALLHAVYNSGSWT